MSFKILDGTRPDKRLCDSCRCAMIIKGSQQGQEVLWCSQLGLHGSIVPFRVVECNEYDSKTSMSKYEMEKIGWVMEVKNGKHLGFKPPQKENKD